MKFYEFTQNNSGGGFQVDEQLTHRLYIEAKDENEACRIAENMGVYFDGVEEGSDCPCCGDRWYRPSEINREELCYGAFTESDAISIAESYECSAVLREDKPTWGQQYTRCSVFQH